MQYPVIISGTVTSARPGTVCMTAQGYVVDVAPTVGDPVRVELSLGPLVPPLHVGDSISLTEYGDTVVFGPSPNFEITRNGQLVVYVSESTAFSDQPPLPVSLAAGSIDCSGAALCGAVTRRTVTAEAGGESIALHAGESGRVGDFDVFSGGATEHDPNSKCGDWGGSTLNVALVRRQTPDAGADVRD